MNVSLHRVRQALRVTLAVTAFSASTLSSCAVDPGAHVIGAPSTTQNPSVGSAASPPASATASSSRPPEEPGTPGSGAVDPDGPVTVEPTAETGTPAPERTPGTRPAPGNSTFTTYGQSELVTALNKSRRELGLAPVRFEPRLAQLAEACARKNLEARTLSHCGYETLWGTNSTARLDPDKVISVWFHSPKHREVLTGPVLTMGGGAIVTDGVRVVAALRVGRP